MRNLFGTLSTLALMAAMSGSAGAQEQPTTAGGFPSDYTMKQVNEIHSFFGVPENLITILDGSQPQSLYAWQHMSHFYPTAQVERGGPVQTLPVEIDPSIWDITIPVQDQSISVRTLVEKTPFDAMMVVKSGTIVLEHYKTMQPSDKHNWYSSGKVISSTLLALLEAEGKIGVGMPVPFYLEELKGTDWDDVTVEEVLDMATGLDGTEHDEGTHDETNNPEQIWFKWAAALGFMPDLLNENADPWDVLRGMKRRKPGYTSFEYNSINTFVLERIVERVAGKPLNEVFSERIWSRIGAEHDSYAVVSDQGYQLFLGFHSATLRDMARFAMVFTPSWNKVSSEKIFPDEMLTKIQTTGRPEIFDKGVVGGQIFSTLFPSETMTNRYQWDVVFQDGDIYKEGVGGQGLYVSPSRDTVVVWYCTGCGYGAAMAREIVKTIGD